MFCLPSCKACRESGACPKGDAPDSAFPASETVPKSRIPSIRNEMFKDTPLKCGCLIPWPIVSLLGTGGKIVKCDLHGWQPVTQRMVAEGKKMVKKSAKVVDGQLPLCPF